MPNQRNDGPSLFEDAEADYRKALELIGDPKRHAALYYVVLLNRGMMWLLRDDLTAAASDFQAAIDLNPKRFEAFVNLGQVYQKQERTDDAVKQFTRAIESATKLGTLVPGRR